ncbi:alginate O-acetyltransferase [Thermodesulfobacteriota bacterium B35]
MSSRRFHLLYSLLFLSMLLSLSLPSLRSLASFSVPSRARIMDGVVSHVFEQYYDRSFPARTLGTNVWAAIAYVLFAEGRPGVVVGRQGWLYTDEEFRTYPQADSRIGVNLETIARVADLLGRRHIRLVMAVVPAKARIYPEYVAGRRPAPVQVRMYDRLLAMLRRAAIPAPDLRVALSAGRTGGQVFFRTDTHWTPYGAEVAAHALAEVIRRNRLLPPGRQQYVTERLAPRSHAGDLLAYLPLDPWCSFLLPPADILVERKTRHRSDDADDLLLAGPQPVAVALVGTSYSADPRWNFAGALRRELRRDLVNYAEKGEGPVEPMLRYLRSDDFADMPPALVLWEFPERYLPMPAGGVGGERRPGPGADDPLSFP